MSTSTSLDTRPLPTSPEPPASTVSSISSGSHSSARAREDSSGKLSISRLRQTWHDEAQQSKRPIGNEWLQQKRVSSDNSGYISSLADKRAPKRHSGGFLIQPNFDYFRRKKAKVDSDGVSAENPDRKGKARVLSNEGREIQGPYPSVRQGEGSFTAGHTTQWKNRPESRRSSNMQEDDIPKHHTKSRMRSHTNGASSGTADDIDSERRPPEVNGTAQEVEHALHEGPAIDEVQLVRMALSLSESRRLHLHPGQLPSSGTSGVRQTTVEGVRQASNTSRGHVRDYRKSLGESLTRPRGSSDSPSPTSMAGVSQPNSSVSRQSPILEQVHRASIVQFDGDDGYVFSDATLSRADKARTYIEMSFHYRRLLQFLPPLKPNSTHHDNSHITTVSAPGSTGVHMTRITTNADAQHELGRVYNPLQYVRNRKVRARERVMLDTETTGWNDLHSVTTWVDSVQTEAGKPGYRVDDVVVLPEWQLPARTTANQKITAVSPTNGHGPDSILHNSKVKRPKLDWVIDPADLLADAYWLEQDNHKTLIESRFGNKIFESFRRPRQSFQDSSQSYESPNGLSSDYGPSPESGQGSNSPDSFASRGVELNNFDKPENYTVPSKLSTTSRVKRTLLGSRRRRSNSSSNLSVSDKDEVSGVPLSYKARPKTENTAALERHMNKILAMESRNHSKQSLQISSPENATNLLRVATGPGDAKDSFQEKNASVRSFDSSEARLSLDTDRTGTPRISLEDFDAVNELPSNKDVAPTDSPIELAYEPNNHVSRSQKRMGLSFLKRHREKIRNGIAENDFVETHNQATGHAQSFPKPVDSPRSSLESPLRTDTNISRKSGSIFKVNPTRSQDAVDQRLEHAQPPPTTKRFFKGGRIGDILHDEKPQGGVSVWKRYPPRHGSMSTSASGHVSNTSVNDDYGQASFAPVNEEHEKTVYPWAAMMRRSLSTNDLKSLKQKPNYRLNKLPSFKPTKALEDHDEEDSMLRSPSKTLSRQSSALGKPNRHSRFDRFVPSILTDSDRDVSPHTASPTISRHTTRDRPPGAFDTRLQSYSFPKEVGAYNRPRFNSRVIDADRRLNIILSEPGGVGLGGRGVTGLTAIEGRSGAYLGMDRGQWSIASRPSSPARRPLPSVTYKDIAYVRCLLLSSGVKAKAIAWTADTPRNKVPEFLLRASEISRACLVPVARREEHVLAAQLLSSHLETSVANFEDAAEKFLSGTCTKLQSQLDDLRESVSVTLTPRTRVHADEADAFTARLNTQHTLAVRQVNDAVDLMMRSRRRRLRFLRRAVFGLLEWVLVGIMWLVWLFVFCFQMIRGAIVGILRGVRWLLWL